MSRNAFACIACAVVVLAAGCRDEEGSPSSAPTPPAETQTAEIAGSVSCRACHETFYEKWATSFHGLAMQPFTAALARERLRPQVDEIVIGEHAYRADMADGKTVVRERGPDGEKAYPIEHVMGGKNVFYFLTPMERGRLQVLPVAYDVRKEEWYDTTASMVRHVTGLDEAIHWTHRALTFNSSCYSCHVSQLSKNYSLA
ncbi:MAG: hypothetical protein JXA69_13395, partial [Phycisphaerae bacterium]|nr:hypothetical protein [Phycisphaerae bacterium]